jgi:hypothetical protein
MLLSKIAMDVEAKHTKSLIAEWRYQDVPKKLWPILNNILDPIPIEQLMPVSSLISNCNF